MLFFAKRTMSSKALAPASGVMHYHNPAARPAAPIIQRVPLQGARVHWWNATTTAHPAGFVPAPVEALPACGFFPPSASFDPLSDDLPWAAVTVPTSSSSAFSFDMCLEFPTTKNTLPPALPSSPILFRHSSPSPIPFKTKNTQEPKPKGNTKAKAIAPLARVRTITRVQGRAIVQRRGMPQGADACLVGLGIQIQTKRNAPLKTSVPPKLTHKRATADKENTCV